MNSTTSSSAAKSPDDPAGSGDGTDTGKTPPPARRRLAARLITTGRRVPHRTIHRDLAVEQVHQNLVLARSGVITAWYLADPTRWSFRTDSERNRMISTFARRLSELAPRSLHLRITHRPYDIAAWARSLYNNAVDPLADWGEYVEDEQRKVSALALDDKVVYWGVEIGRLSGSARGAARMLGRAAVRRELGVLRDEITAVDRTMAGAGMRARPCDAQQMDWLMTRSLGLGLPAPVTANRPSGLWMPEDIAEWTDGVQWYAPDPMAGHIVVRGDRDGRQVDRYVATATMGAMELGAVPESGSGPWLQWLDRLPFDWELSARIEVRAAAEVTREILGQLGRITSQARHYAEHGVEPPLSMSRQHSLAQIVEDEVRANFSGLSTRTSGWYRVAVSGRSPEEMKRRMGDLRDLYGAHIAMVHTKDQYRTAREFIPGEPLANTNHKRRLPVTTLAGSLPTATARVGDPSGFNLGYTSGNTRRAVHWDPWRSQEKREASGLTLVAASPGGGKTFAAGATVYHTVRSGVPWVVVDPSGPFGKLCDLPELKPHSISIDLANAEPGTLNPFRVIPDPDLAHYDPRIAEYARQSDPQAAARKAFEHARRMTQAQRKSLCVDVLSGILRPQIRNTEQAQRALFSAVRAVQGHEHDSPRDVINALRGLRGAEMSEYGQHLADLLDDAADMPQTQLIFPSAEGGDDRYLTAHHRLVVFGLQGLKLPSESTDPAEWTLDELYSMPLLYLASWYAHRAIYSRPMGERKGLVFDESHVLLRTGSGRHLLAKTGRDSRKHNLRALFISQDGDDHLAAGTENWIDSVLVGRTVGESAVAAALRLLRVKPDVGHEEILAGLSPVMEDDEPHGPREFLFRDGDGRIERITVVMDHRPDLVQALDSTADPYAARTALAPPTGPGLSKQLDPASFEFATRGGIGMQR